MKEDIMRMLSGFLALVLLLGTVPVVWAQADPAKEVADIRAKQGAAGAKGEVDGVMAPMADNVVFTAARAGFRIEGKEAVPDVGQDRRSPAARRCAQLGYAGRPVHPVAQNSALCGSGNTRARAPPTPRCSSKPGPAIMGLSQDRLGQHPRLSPSGDARSPCSSRD